MKKDAASLPFNGTTDAIGVQGTPKKNELTHTVTRETSLSEDTRRRRL
jgi:hypothetical protein